MQENHYAGDIVVLEVKVIVGVHETRIAVGRGYGRGGGGATKGEHLVYTGDEMANEKQVIKEYLMAVQKLIAAGNATERSGYGHLNALLEGLKGAIVGTTEPKRIECGPIYL